MFTVLFIQRFGLSIEEIGQCLDGARPPRWTLVDISLTGGNCLCIGMAACKTTLATLGLGQQGVNLISHGVSFYLETYRGISQ
jgi:hypothetical protein